MGRAPSQRSKPSSEIQKKTYKLSAQERRTKKKAKEEKLDALFDDVKQIFHDKEDAVATLATKYDVSEDTIRGFMGEAKMANARSINAKNAYAHWRLQELNKDRLKGEKLSLKDFHQDYANEYETLDDETMEIAINALKEHCESKRIPVRKRGRVALRDVNKTMPSIATMADQLALRTDHQILILASKTSHQSYAAPMAHVTPSAEGFTDTLFKTDLFATAHHFEAYGTEGLQGLTHSSQSIHSHIKGEVVGALRKNLRAVSDRRDASVSYKHFHHKVVLRYNVDLVGWPSSIPFKNPSELKRAHLKEIHALATSTPPQLHFVALTQEELSQCIAMRVEDEANGSVEPWVGNKRKTALTGASSSLATPSSSSVAPPSSSSSSANNE